MPNKTSRRTWTDEQLITAVAEGNGYRSTLTSLGLQPRGGNYAQLKKYILEYNLDTSHWNGQGWNRGRKFPTKKTFVQDKLTADSNWNTNVLRRQLISSGMFEHRCQGCNLNSWLNNLIPLELDHINGIRTDNRIENLRILCPNCHALTPTYRGKNKKSV